MSEEQKAAYVIAMAACVNARVAGMQAERLALFRDQIKSGCGFTDGEWINSFHLACRLLDASRARLAEVERDEAQWQEIAGMVQEAIAPAFPKQSAASLAPMNFDAAIRNVLKRLAAAEERASALAEALADIAEPYLRPPHDLTEALACIQDMEEIARAALAQSAVTSKETT